MIVRCLTPLAGLLVTVALMIGPAAAQAPAACPSTDFKAFLAAFQDDVAVQKAFTARPLQSEANQENPDANGEPYINVTKMLDGDAIEFPVMGTAVQLRQEKLKLEVTRQDPAEAEIKIFLDDTDYQIRYFFKKTASCWQLYRMANDSL